jgi:hypothetical protein
VRRTIAAEENEIQSLAGYRAVFGHFDLDTLLRVAPPAAIATVLREPRARLLSLYMFARFTPGLAEEHYPFDGITGSDGPLDGFLDSLTDGINGDNQITRMLLRGDPRVPKGNLIDAANIEALADAALARLDQLGFVGILETGAEVWDGLSRIFGVELKPVRANVSGERGYRPGSFPVPDWDAERTVRRLEDLTTVDAIVYERLVERRLGGQRAARRYADAAFVRQLARFGAASGNSLAEVQARVAKQVTALAHLHTEVATRDATIASLHEEVAKRDATVAWLHEEVARRDAIVVSLHEEVAQRDATVGWLHEEVTERDATAVSLHEEVAGRDARPALMHEVNGSRVVTPRDDLRIDAPSASARP